MRAGQHGRRVDGRRLDTRRGSLGEVPNARGEQVQSAGTTVLVWAIRSHLQERSNSSSGCFPLFLLALSLALGWSSLCCGRSALLGFLLSGDSFPGRFLRDVWSGSLHPTFGGTDPRTRRGLVRYPRSGQARRLSYRFDPGPVWYVLGLRFSPPGGVAAPHSACCCEQLRVFSFRARRVVSRCF